MNFTAKEKRLSVLTEIPYFARLDHRKGKLNFMSNLSKSQRKELKVQAKKITEKYISLMKKIKQSGAGFQVDKFIRELAYEYTHRFASSGTDTQPLNFNYFESFCNIKLFSNTNAPYCVPAKEIDHLFNLTDYFDYYTSDKIDNTDLSSLMELPECTTFHFTTNGNISDFSILNSKGREFLISGFSMIRRNTSLHWYLIGGEVLTTEEWNLQSTNQEKISMDTVDKIKRTFLEESIKRNNYSAGSFVELDGTTSAVRTIISGEIDLIKKEYLGRCLMTETDNSFNIICDDPEIFLIDDENERQNMISLMKEQINHASPMWDLANSMFQLPSYFAYKISVTKDIVIAAGQHVKKIKSNGGRGIHAQYKTVSSIDIIDKNSPVVRQIIPAFYKTNIDGHWRRLPNGSTGKGINGEIEPGRTWVKTKSEWREIKNEQKIIYIKSSIEVAKLKVFEYEKNAKSVSENTSRNTTKKNSKYGELYILRCTTMKDEIYKVGWTSGTSIERANQLSSATGIPIAFVVVDSWKHIDAEALEKSVHAMLEPYRVNDRREFFKSNYTSIRNIIESEIKRSELIIL
ncbi:MAG: GIY-YIG nuclease family protein [Campylobacteraceae bacterium]|nr:GIY-YIG nuclease family protein [Campylobacteraceae bacterium]